MRDDVAVRLGLLLQRVAGSPEGAEPDASLSHLDSIKVLDLLLLAEAEFDIHLDASALLATGAMETFVGLVGFVERELAGQQG